MFWKRKIQVHWAALWAEVNGPYWNREFFKVEGEDFFFNIEEQNAGDCLQLKREKKRKGP